MAKRGDNIHKRNDGRWEGRYKKGRKNDGSIQYGSVYGRTYREVKEKMTQALIMSPSLDRRANTEITFDEVLELWMKSNEIRLKGGTINKYQSIIDAHIRNELGTVKMSELSALRINTFLAEKMQKGRRNGAGGLSPSYVRSILLVISAALKYATSEQLCEPLKSPLSKPTIPKRELQIFSSEEQRQLEDFLSQDLSPTKAGILISLHTGLRIGEICALSWNDIDLEQRVINIRHTVARIRDSQKESGHLSCLIIDSPKTPSSQREIPISSALYPILVNLSAISKSPYVISETQCFVSPRTFEYRYHKLLEECGISSLNYHALRHTFATRCIEVGVDVKSLSEILGHANVGITLNTYVHSSMELKRSQLEKLY